MSIWAMNEWTDYLFKAPSSAQAAKAIAAMVADGLITAHDDMLGPKLLDATTGKHVGAGRHGVAPINWTDQHGKAHATPAMGEPASFYVAIRTALPARAWTPAQYGVSACTAAESAAVLGVWQ